MLETAVALFVFVLVFELIVSGMWKCLVGSHLYMYAGRKSGMSFDTRSRQVNGTMRTIYRCARCNKFKPVEVKDYEQENNG